MQSSPIQKLLLSLRKPRLATRLLAWFLLLTTVPMALIMYVTYERGAAGSPKGSGAVAGSFSPKPKRCKSKTTWWNGSAMSRVCRAFLTSWVRWAQELSQAFKKGGISYFCGIRGDR